MKWLGVIAFAVACAGTREPSVPVSVTIDPRLTGPLPVRLEPSAEVPAPVVVPEPAKTSYLIKDDARVHADATARSEQLGTLQAGTRIGVRTLGVQTGDCRWLEIEPRGWICTRAEPSPLPPTDEVYPSLWTRGYDGRLYRDADDVRAGGGYVPDDPPAILRPFPDAAVDIAGKKFLRTVGGELVPVAAVPRYWGSEFTGVTLEDSAVQLPVGWTWFHESWKKPTPVRAEPSGRARVVRELPLRSRFPVLAEQGPWVRIGDGEWVSREDVRIARASDPPAEVTAADEIWVDVSQAEETLVLYRGKTPIRATLVSTGRPEYGTPTGVFRIKRKTALTAFDSPRPDLVDYHIKDVAWVMHITDIYALHGAWWNRGFGAPISLGCVDIPATDLRAVYEAVEPKVPPGWWQVFATADRPGSVVRIRSRGRRPFDP